MAAIIAVTNLAFIPIYTAFWIVTIAVCIFVVWAHGRGLRE